MQRLRAYNCDILADTVHDFGMLHGTRHGTRLGTRLGTDRRTSLVMTCHFCAYASPLRRHPAQTLPIAYVATSGIFLTVGPGHRAIPRWKEGNVLLPTVHRCIYGFNCETDARRSSVCSRQRLRCIKGPQGKRSTTLLQLAFASQMGPDIEQYIVGKRETPSCL